MALREGNSFFKHPHMSRGAHNYNTYLYIYMLYLYHITHFIAYVQAFTFGHNKASQSEPKSKTMNGVCRKKELYARIP